MLDRNALSPAPTADTRLPRNPIGSFRIAITAWAALASTPSSMSLSCRIVLITPPTASIALATSPLFFSFSLSISASTPLRASEYLDARVCTNSVPLASTDSVSSSNFPENSPAACLPIACRSAGSLRTSACSSLRPAAIRALARVNSVPIRSATRRDRPAASGSHNPAGPSRRSDWPPRAGR